ncbi:MAG: bifunctional nuclease domain-containing protein [Bacteroidota bacterium]
MSEKRELAITALSMSESHPGKYALILESVGTNKRIPLIIGESEAQAIAIAMEKMTPSRPLTHDLLLNLIVSFEATVVEVLIHSLIDGVFHAKIILKKQIGTVIELDARSSDAIALAIRSGAPVYMHDALIDEAGFLAEMFFASQRKGSLAEYSIAELEDLLQKVIEKEDYESAVRIRDYIDKRRAQLGDK